MGNFFKKIWKKISNWKTIVVILTSITGIIFSIKYFFKKINFFKKDDINDMVEKVKKNNKRLIDESRNYANRRLQFYQKLKKRTSKKL